MKKYKEEKQILLCDDNLYCIIFLTASEKLLYEVLIFKVEKESFSVFQVLNKNNYFK